MIPTPQQIMHAEIEQAEFLAAIVAFEDGKDDLIDELSAWLHLQKPGSPKSHFHVMAGDESPKLILSVLLARAEEDDVLDAKELPSNLPFQDPLACERFGRRLCAQNLSLHLNNLIFEGLFDTAAPIAVAYIRDWLQAEIDCPDQTPPCAWLRALQRR